MVRNLSFYPVYSGRPSGFLKPESDYNLYYLENNFACFMENRLLGQYISYLLPWNKLTPNLGTKNNNNYLIVSEDQDSVSGFTGGSHSEFLVGCSQPVVGAAVV